MAVAAPRTAPARRSGHAQPAARSTHRSERQSRVRLSRWVLWIVAVGGLLAGIVALNVAVLELRTERSRLQTEILELRSENAAIEGQLSRTASVGRIETAARIELGLAEPKQTIYLKLESRPAGR